MRCIVALISVLLGLVGCSQASWGSGKHTVSGVVLVPGQSKGLAANAVVHLFASDGQHITAFCDNDGSFTVKGVPKGSHLLQAHLMQFYYPELRVEVRPGGMVVGFFASPGPGGKEQQIQTMQEPLLIQAAGAMQYFENRQGFDLWGFIKTPYGIMIVFSVFFIFIFPMMKVDPEEYKQIQEVIKGATPATNKGQQSQARIKG